MSHLYLSVFTCTFYIGSFFVNSSIMPYIRIFLLPLALWVTFGDYIILFLKKYNVFLPVKDELIEISHNKDHTPSMGGVFIYLFFLVGVLSSILENIPTSKFFYIYFLLFTTAFFIIGVADDICKIRFRNGLTITFRFYMYIFLGFLASCILFYYKPIYVTTSGLPFFLANFFGVYILSTIIVSGSVNAANIVDGIDGLLSTLFLMFIMPFICVLLFQFNKINIGDGNLHLAFAAHNDVRTMICIYFVAAGSVLGYLVYNKFPSRIFMGDSGSIFLGSLLGIAGLLVHSKIIFLFLIFPFFLEIFSVMIQIVFFRLFGVRVFPITPLHHTLQMKKVSEKKIVFISILLNIVFHILAILVGAAEYLSIAIMTASAILRS